MSPNEYEELVLGLILRFPSTNRIAERITGELTDDKFISKDHRLIYRAIKQLVTDGQIANTVNTAKQLNSHLDSCGGIEYLESLTRLPESAGIFEPKGYDKWVEAVDSAGRLYKVVEATGKFKKEDFEKIFISNPNVDELIIKLMEELNEALKSSTTAYRSIKEFGDEELRYFEKEKSGEVVDIIPCNLKCLRDNFIPRPYSFGGIIGSSGTGKTSLALQIGLDVAQNLYHNKQEGIVSINSLETMGRRVFRKLACYVAKINSEELAAGSLSTHQLDNYHEAVHYVMGLPIVMDDNPSITSDEVYSQSLLIDMQYGRRVLGISDYTELFSDKAASEELRVSGIVKKIKSISKKTGSCEILLSQYSNESVKNAYRIGSLSGSRYSGLYEQALDWGLVVYNPRAMRKKGYQFTLPDGYSEDLAYIIKQKDRDYSTSQIEMEWIPEYSMFKDLSMPIGSHYQIPKRIEF